MTTSQPQEWSSPPVASRTRGVVLDHDDKLGDRCSASRFHNESPIEKTPDYIDTCVPRNKLTKSIVRRVLSSHRKRQIH